LVILSREAVLSLGPKAHEPPTVAVDPAPAPAPARAKPKAGHPKAGHKPDHAKAPVQ
jgi:hypothetical protein